MRALHLLNLNFEPIGFNNFHIWKPKVTVTNVHKNIQIFYLVFLDPKTIMFSFGNFLDTI